MKRTMLYLLTICMCGCMSMFGQTDSAKTMKQLDASADDYIPLLNGSGYEAFPFDISSLSDGQLEKPEQTGTVRRRRLGHF